MGLRVVAEGIEDVDTLDLLSDLGCAAPRASSSVDRPGEQAGVPGVE
jgi:hypothetical protein